MRTETLHEKMREAGYIVAYSRTDVVDFAMAQGEAIPYDDEWRQVEKQIERGLNEYVWDVIKTVLRDNEEARNDDRE